MNHIFRPLQGEKDNKKDSRSKHIHPDRIEIAHPPADHIFPRQEPGFSHQVFHRAEEFSVKMGNVIKKMLHQVPDSLFGLQVQHFFKDITHFDGKFFSTVKYLMRKPGFLSREYMVGRRMSYLNPIRMYVFTSAIFFIILFSLKRPEDMIHDKKEKNQSLSELTARQVKLTREIAAEKEENHRNHPRTSPRPDNFE